MIDGQDNQVQYSQVFICLPNIQTYKASYMDKKENETQMTRIGTVPSIQKTKWQTTEHELVNESFEPFEQVSQEQAQLLGTTFEMLSGGPA